MKKGKTYVNTKTGTTFAVGQLTTQIKEKNKTVVKVPTWNLGNHKHR
ncbi:hypothetical protein MHTCC0001_09700 [Flavobacteriaceae bacterium MHTCC 0001]